MGRGGKPVCWVSAVPGRAGGGRGPRSALAGVPERGGARRGPRPGVVIGLRPPVVLARCR